MEDTKIKDEDLALLNSLRGKWVVYPPGVAYDPVTTVILVDTLDDAIAVKGWMNATKSDIYIYDFEEVTITIKYWSEETKHTGLIDRLREIVNERGMVREKVG